MPTVPKSSSSTHPFVRPTKRPMTRAPKPAAAYHDDSDDGVAEERPRTSRGPVERADRKVVGEFASGWGGQKKIGRKGSEWAPKLEAEEGSPAIIKFFQDEGPFLVYRQHWCPWMPKGEKKSYVCAGDDCPICDKGDRPAYKEVYNVIDVTDPEDPKVVILTLGRRDSKKLVTLNNDRTGPLTNPSTYYRFERLGDGSDGPIQTQINAVKARDLEEDWDVTPLTEDEIQELASRAWTAESVISLSSMEVLQQVADLSD